MRIRTIKPEFWDSESLGRLSRDARLLFIGTWSLADDSGRLRGSSRFLASRLFPFDDDALEKIPGWIDELINEKCVRLYEVNGDHYMDIPKWLSHQKIDHPSVSKLPAFASDSEVLANPREGSGEDQGSGIRDQGMEGNGSITPPIQPDGWSLEDCQQAAKRISMLPVMVQSFYDNYAAVGWIDAAGRKIVNLHAALRKWKANQSNHKPKTGSVGSVKMDEKSDPALHDYAKQLWEARKSNASCQVFVAIKKKVCQGFSEAHYVAVLEQSKVLEKREMGFVKS